MRQLTTLGLCVLLLAAATAAAAAPMASYRISAELDPDSHRVRGEERIRWTNTTANPTGELRFHLYLNAFSSTETSFMRHLGAGTLRTGLDTDPVWGFIEVKRLTDGDGRDLLAGLEFIRPDDGNPADYSVARVPLPEPVPPGGTIILDVGFTAQLPRVIARTGFAGDFHMVGQWFPKLGVLEDDGWHCHQLHANSEFFADFATYDVTLTVPAGWVVGASGIETGRGSTDDGRDRLRFRAEDVHDFAWSAAPPDLMTVVEAEFDPSIHVPDGWLEEAARALDRPPAELALPPVYLRLLVPAEQAELAPRMLRAARLSVAWLGLYLGPYPHPQLTLVSPPPTAFEAGGMEYPTLVTTGALRLMASPPASWARWIETVTAHEIGHQYFQGLLASNEAEEAWLDEGLTTWAENHAVAAMIASGALGAGVGLEPWARERLGLAAADFPVRPDRPARDFRRRFDYFRASYTRTALALKSLEGIVGRDVVLRGLRAYVEEHRFTHPHGDDLIASLEAAAETDLDWFFDQVIRGDATVDWAVLDVRCRRPRSPAGLAWTGAGWEPRPAADPGGDDPQPWEVEVDVGRRGDLVGPVEVRIRFADGQEQWRRWDGRDRWVRWSLTAPSPVVEVVVDPRAAWALERRRADNYWRSAEHAPPSEVEHLWWLRPLLTVLVQGALPWS